MKLLLTSFRTWLPHQKSNSSDELLEIVATKSKDQYYFLRQLPVDVSLASREAISTIKKIQPQGVICCGMAEYREQLTIESSATFERNYLQTKVDLEFLISQLSHTKISHDAGKFVCEGLYYRVLKYLEQSKLFTSCIFVHVPLLTQENQKIIVQDFDIILKHFNAQ